MSKWAFCQGGEHFDLRVGDYRERFAAAEVERCLRELVQALGA